MSSSDHFFWWQWKWHTQHKQWFLHNVRPFVLRRFFEHEHLGGERSTYKHEIAQLSCLISHLFFSACRLYTVMKTSWSSSLALPVVVKRKISHSGCSCQVSWGQQKRGWSGKNVKLNMLRSWYKMRFYLLFTRYYKTTCSQSRARDEGKNNKKTIILINFKKLHICIMYSTKGW